MYRHSVRKMGRAAMRWFVVILLVLIVAFPMFWILQMSLKTELEAFQMPPRLLFVPTFHNYETLLKGPFLRSFGNSSVVSVLSMLVSLIIGVPAAYTLSRAKFRSLPGLSFWVLFTRMAPPIAFGLPYFFIYMRLKLLDTLLGLVLIYLTFNLSLVIWMMRTFFDGLSRSLEEAAYIDGASVTQAFLQITLPLSAPGLATTAIFCFLLTWNDFFYALILTRSKAVTAPVAVVNFMNYTGWDFGGITAAAVVVALPVIFFSLLIRRYLVHGLTAGALKM